MKLDLIVMPPHDFENKDRHGRDDSCSTDNFFLSY